MNSARRLFSLIGLSKRPWWVKIETEAPVCLYYFGPFDSKEEANKLRPGYVEDLLCEGAQSIKTVIENADPERLTICDIADADGYLEPQLVAT